MMRDREKPQKVPEFITILPTSDKKLYCNICNNQLLPDHSCGKCGIFYLPEQAKHQIQIKGMDGKEPGPYARRHTIPIAFIDNEKSKTKDMGPAFEGLKKSGYHFTSYSDSNV